MYLEEIILQMESTAMNKDRLKKEIVKNKISQRLIKVFPGNVASQNVDVVVNSVSRTLHNGLEGQISKSIINKTGNHIKTEAINEATRLFGSANLEEGSIVSTSAGSAPNLKYVIHGNFPAYSGAASKVLLSKMVTDTLKLCDRHKVSSIAIPPVASGVKSFPTNECARAIHAGCLDFLEDVNWVSSIKDLNIVILEADKAEIFKEEWDRVCKERGDELEANASKYAGAEEGKFN